ncbi:MAG: MarR family transcriptional regulator [Pseudomonadota bacterium]
MSQPDLSPRDAMECLRRTFCETVRADRPDLTARQLAILLTVVLEAGPHTVRGLAAQLDLSKPVVTRAIDALSRFDLVRRRPDERDLRSVLIERTPSGTAFLRDLAAPIMGGVAQDKVDAGSRDQAAA